MGKSPVHGQYTGWGVQYSSPINQAGATPQGIQVLVSCIHLTTGLVVASPCTRL